MTITAPCPPPKTDFRNAQIDHHWNDPPQVIFHKHVDVNHPIDAELVSEVIGGILEDVKQAVKPAQKRLFEDTSKRIQVLLTKLSQGQLEERLIRTLGLMCQELEAKAFPTAMDIHAKLMVTDFDQHGQWLLGVKRLIDLYESVTM